MTRADDIPARFGLVPVPPEPQAKLGISTSALSGDRPIHGLRHPPEGDTCGWYVWAGEYSDEADFFAPMHVEHLVEALPFVAPYLSLPPGWRFLLADDHEDVWEDKALLDVSPP